MASSFLKVLNITVAFVYSQYSGFFGTPESVLVGIYRVLITLFLNFGERYQVSFSHKFWEIFHQESWPRSIKFS